MCQHRYVLGVPAAPCSRHVCSPPPHPHGTGAQGGQDLNPEQLPRARPLAFSGPSPASRPHRNGLGSGEPSAVPRWPQSLITSHVSQVDTHTPSRRHGPRASRQTPTLGTATFALSHPLLWGPWPLPLERPAEQLLPIPCPAAPCPALRGRGGGTVPGGLQSLQSPVELASGICRKPGAMIACFPPARRPPREETCELLDSISVSLLLKRVCVLSGAGSETSLTGCTNTPSAARGSFHCSRRMGSSLSALLVKAGSQQLCTLHLAASDDLCPSHRTPSIPQVMESAPTRMPRPRGCSGLCPLGWSGRGLTGSGVPALAPAAQGRGVSACH